MPQHLFVIIDMQADFIQDGGALPVPGGERVSEKMNEFFAESRDKLFDLVLFTHDTHAPEEYAVNAESKVWPMHCAYGTPGWRLTVEPRVFRKQTPVWHMAKNSVDLWAAPVAKNVVKEEKAAKVFANLGNVTDDPTLSGKGIGRDDFMRSIGLGSKDGLDVTLAGVASDYALHDAALGFLGRGARVRVVENFVAGRGGQTPGRAESGDMRDVLALPAFSTYVRSNYITLISSSMMAAPFTDVH